MELQEGMLLAMREGYIDEKKEVENVFFDVKVGILVYVHSSFMWAHRRKNKTLFNFFTLFMTHYHLTSLPSSLSLLFPIPHAW